jgi:hypothetical protein
MMIAATATDRHRTRGRDRLSMPRTEEPGDEGAMLETLPVMVYPEVVFGQGKLSGGKRNKKWIA